MVRMCFTNALCEPVLTSFWAPHPLGTNLEWQLSLGLGKCTPKCISVDKHGSSMHRCDSKIKEMIFNTRHSRVKSLQ